MKFAKNDPGNPTRLAGNKCLPLNCRKHGDLQRMSDVPLWHILQTIMYYSLPCSRVCVSVCESVCVGMCKSECVCAGVWVYL